MGIFWEKVSSDIPGVTVQSASDVEIVLGGAVEYRHYFTQVISGSMKARAILNTNNSLAPVIDLLLAVGYLF